MSATLERTPSIVEPRRVVPPDRDTVFAASARRFGQLSERHSLGDWLRFLGRLAQAQHDALRAFPTAPLPLQGIRERAERHGMPPLPAHNWPRDAVWRSVLGLLIEAVEEAAPASGREVLRALRAAPAPRLEMLADRVLRMEFGGDEVAALSLVGAALQVYWTHMASTLGVAGIAPLDVPGVCPCCGFLPVASVMRAEGDVANLRYLRCALCNTEWNFVRIKCAACDANDRIAYRQIDGVPGVVRAETCETCRSYVKIVHRDRDGDADPVADDLASLALDLLMDEAGYTRAGPNLLLAPG